MPRVGSRSGSVADLQDVAEDPRGHIRYHILGKEFDRRLTGSAIPWTIGVPGLVTRFHFKRAEHRSFFLSFGADTEASGKALTEPCD